MKPRTNPRYASMPPLKIAEGVDDDFEPIKGDLAAMLQTGGWDRVVDNLRARMAHLQARIATDTRMTESEWRLLQREYGLYERMIREPLTFFTESQGH